MLMLTQQRLFRGIFAKRPISIQPRGGKWEPQSVTDEVGFHGVCQKNTSTGQRNNSNDEMKHRTVLLNNLVGVKILRGTNFLLCFRSIS